VQRVIRILKKAVYPLRRLGKVIFDLVVLDLAMVIYGYAKKQFKNERPEEDVTNDFLWPDFKKGRRW
jgi:hypothetical protein